MEGNILKGKPRGVHGVCSFAGLLKIVQQLEVGVSQWHRQTDKKNKFDRQKKAYNDRKKRKGKEKEKKNIFATPSIKYIKKALKKIYHKKRRRKFFEPPSKHLSVDPLQKN